MQDSKDNALISWKSNRSNNQAPDFIKFVRQPPKWVLRVPWFRKPLGIIGQEFTVGALISPPFFIKKKPNNLIHLIHVCLEPRIGILNWIFRKVANALLCTSAEPIPSKRVSRARSGHPLNPQIHFAALTPYLCSSEAEN
jgi:hypothetical protein